MAQVIHAQTIVSSLRLLLDPDGTRHIDFSKPVSTYISGDAGALPAFADVLNKSPQFRGYGLALVPGDFINVKIVEDMVTAIIRWFQNNGWTVVA